MLGAVSCLSPAHTGSLDISAASKASQTTVAPHQSADLLWLTFGISSSTAKNRCPPVTAMHGQYSAESNQEPLLGQWWLGNGWQHACLLDPMLAVTPKSPLADLLLESGKGTFRRNAWELWSRVHRGGWVQHWVLCWWQSELLENKRPSQRALCQPLWQIQAYSQCCCSSQPFPSPLVHVNVSQSIRQSSSIFLPGVRWWQFPPLSGLHGGRHIPIFSTNTRKLYKWCSMGRVQNSLLSVQRPNLWISDNYHNPEGLLPL